MIRLRAAFVVGAIVLFAGILTVTGHVLASSSSPQAAAGTEIPVLTVPPAPATTAPPPPQVPAATPLATPEGSVPTFAYPGGPKTGEVGVWYGYPLTLPVLDVSPGWLEVRLPQRPNQSVGWIHASDATLSSTPYRIVVDVTTERMRVYQSGYQVMDFGIGVGTARTPTVTGDYFITVKAPPPSSAYGPFVLSTSAHSDAIQSWEGSGDAIIAIHGPIDSYADSLIGTGRAQVSNGCLRMHVVDLVHLDDIPIGTPLDIVS